MTTTNGDVVYAGLVTRGIAIVIDALVIDAVALIVSAAFLLVESVFSISHRHNSIAAAVGGGLFAAWVISYFVACWTTTGQTPGSRVMQIEVTRTDWSRLRPGRALIRLGAMVVSLPLFWGYLPILWSRHRRGVADLLAGSVVTGTAPGPADQSPPARRDSYSRNGEPAGEHGAPTRAELNRHRAGKGGETIA